MIIIIDSLMFFDDPPLSPPYPPYSLYPSPIHPIPPQIIPSKKRLEQQRNTMLSTQLNVDSVAFQQENLVTTVQTAKALEQTQKVMAKQLKELDVDKVAETQDDINDLMMDMEEVNEVSFFCFS